MRAETVVPPVWKKKQIAIVPPPRHAWAADAGRKEVYERMKKFQFNRFLALALALIMVLGLFPVAGSATGEPAEEAAVKIGAEVLLESEYWQEYLAGKNVALFTNQVCVDAQMNHLADKLAASESINLVCLFGGEHGLRGAYQAGAAVPHCIDATTNLINWSLYSGGTIDTEALGIAPLDEGMENPKSPNRPTRAMLTGNNGKWYEPIDVILFDLQEIGSKTWTYLYNLADLMAACVESEKYYGKEVELIVLDRPSSIGSDTVEGSMHFSNNQTGFARFPLPSRYGLTMGEVALMYQGEGWKYFWQKTYPGGPENLYGSKTSMPSKEFKGVWAWDDPQFADKLSLGECEVKVIPCEGYTRDMYWDETGLQFILPSPNMPTAEACLIYAGTVWFEGLPINEGRGTTKPFEAISAPYINGEELADRLNELNLEGVIFRPISTTTLSTNQLLSGTDYVGKLSDGVQIHITDKRAFSPIEMQCALSLTLRALYGSSTTEENKDGNHFYAHYQIDYRSGSDWVGSTINSLPLGATNEQILTVMQEMLARMDEETADYKVMREKYLLSDYDTPADKELVTTKQPVIVPGYQAFLDNAADYAGKRIGLVTNQTGVDLELNHLADVLFENENVNLTTLFSTGLGLRGEFQTAEEGVYTDSETGLPVYRLISSAPSAEALENVDVLLFDIQDTGSRSNGVAEILNNCIKACAETGKTLTVLDRPAPLGGVKVEGPVDEAYGLSTRHGLTVGEMALYLANRQGVENVSVCKMTGWDRNMLYSDTGMHFIQADRKIATPTALLTYASIGWLEGCGDVANQSGVSHGWGTTKTYEFFGAPYMKENMVAFADALNALELPGVRFRLAAMTPWNNKTELASILYPGTACYGVQLHIMDESAYSSVDTILAILTTMMEYFPEETSAMFTPEFDKIVGDGNISTGIELGRSLPEIYASFQDNLDNFKLARKDVLLYCDGENHAFGAWERVSEPTCTEVGTEERKCECGHVESREIPALGHTEQVVPGYPETCTADGLTDGVICAVCGEVLVAQEVIPAHCYASVYDDVAEEQWFHDAVNYMTKHGLMNGMTETHFGPEQNTNRAMMAVLLYRMAGEPSVEGLKNPFVDVPEDSWFHDAFVWAFHEGIVVGRTETLFDPAAPVTRGEMVTMLYRYAGEPEADVEVLGNYVDSDEVAPYAWNAFAWAIENEVINGMGELMLEPNGTANRAQVATILARYLQK